MIYTIPPAPRRSPKKWMSFVWPDTHVGFHAGLPGHSPCAENVALQALEHYAPKLTHLIVLGDYGGWESLSHWSALRAEHVYIEEDIRLVNAHLDLLDEICDAHGVKKVFIEGNHEFHATLLESKYPQFRDAVNLQRRLIIDEQRKSWTWVPMNHFFKLGKMAYTHGCLPGARDMQALLKEVGHSVTCGHTHGNEIARHRNLDGSHVAMSSGCLSSIDPPPPYARAKVPTRWVNGFYIHQFRANGLFQHRWHEIIDEQYCELLDGTEILADHEEVQYRLDEDQKIIEGCRSEYYERYYHPGGNVVEPEPIGSTEYSARGRRARIIANREK